MMGEHEQLISEARSIIADCSTYNFGMYNANRLAREIAPALADALEKVTAERDAALGAIRDARELTEDDAFVCYYSDDQERGGIASIDLDAILSRATTKGTPDEA